MISRFTRQSRLNSHAPLDDVMHPAWVDPLVELYEGGYWCTTLGGPWLLCL